MDDLEETEAGLRVHIRSSKTDQEGAGWLLKGFPPIGQTVKRYAALAGFKAAEFGGHSLRAGFATSAAEKGASIFRIMDVTRHRSVETVRGYVRRAEEFTDHAGEGLL